MATVNPVDDQNNQNPAGQPTPISGTAGGASSGGQGASSAGASPVAQNQAPQTNQGYTDVGSYLDANKAGSGQLGSQVAGNLTNQYNTVQSGIGQSANDVINQVNQGYVPENTDLINQVAANPEGATQEQQTAFQGQLNDTYSGPTSWGDYGTQQGNVASAQQYANLRNTPGGLNVYAQELEGPQASQGVNQLDTMLLGGSPEAMGQVNAAADPYASLNSFLDTQNSGVGSAIQTGQTQASQAQADALAALTGTYNNLNSAVNQTASERLAQAQAANAAGKSGIQGLYSQALQTDPTQIGAFGKGNTAEWYNTTNYDVGDLSPEAMQALGMDQNQWNTLRDALQQAGTSEQFSGNNFAAGAPTTQIDLMQYLNQQDPTAAINAGTVATPEQYARMDAIQKLLGDKMPQGAAINPLNAAQAGTAPTNFQTFNYDQALADAQRYETESDKAAQQMASLLSSNADLQHAQGQHTGGFLGGLKNAISHPLTSAASIMNPTSWAANAQNILNGKGPNPTNENPFSPSDKPVV